MKKIIVAAAAMALASAHAALVQVNFAFDNIAQGSFEYDAELDGGLIFFADLSSFSLQFAGLTNSLYDLAFVNAGNSQFRHLQWDSWTDSFVTVDISGFPTTLAEIKVNGTAGFFVRDDLKVIRDYAGGGDQFYRELSIRVERNQVPEPSAIALLLVAAGIGAGLKRRRAQA